MRKLNPTREAAAAWAFLACASLSTLAAQTTFVSSNDPTALVTVQRADEVATVLRIEQRPASAGYAPISQHVVLRDTRTGIALPATSRATAHSVTGTEAHVLTFPALDFGPAPELTLADAYSPNSALHIAGLKIGDVPDPSR